MGLNESYSAARGQILLQTPTPNLNKAFSLMIDHESQKNMIHTISDASFHRAIESTALFSQKTYTHGNGNFGHQQGGGDVHPNRGHYDSQYKSHPQKPHKVVVMCEVCGYRGHTKEQCFKVKGYPIGWRSKKKGGTTISYANQVETSQPAGNAAASLNSPSLEAFFTQDQYQQIMQILAKESENAGENSAKAAITDSTLSALVSKYVPMDWIVDTEATDHMIARLDVLDTVQIVPSSKMREVHLPIGNVVSVSHTGEQKYLVAKVLIICCLFQILSVTCYLCHNLSKNFIAWQLSFLIFVFFRISPMDWSGGLVEKIKSLHPQERSHQHSSSFSSFSIFNQ
ncbi:uncharacterized protein LOC129880647 [Solanum dulcamara]|uniref:uncharacterized protein LOC129880647 n=1 Tax=Solanum dulcamara TaxID=45834 RepID=UPI0024864B6E|nr:uncharacterized protein LOC129880647 [Solanum dulcamara]